MFYRKEFLPVFVLSALFYSFSIAQSDRWIADASSKSLKNPVQATRASIKAGRTLYNTNCIACHGENGKGDGPGANALNPKPADHTSARVHDQTDGELFWKISEGRGAMIGWKNIISEEDRWNLVNYLRTLKEN